MSTRTLQHICLISPKRDQWSKTEKIRDILEKNNRYLKAWYAPNLSLLTIAGITPADIKITYIDEDFESIDFNAKYDLVGISAMTQQIVRGYEIASEFRERNIFVVIGGIHSTVMPEEALQYADAVFIGESEKTWLQFLNDYRNNIEKRIYKQDKDTFPDLQHVDLPQYDIIKDKNYFKDPNYFYNMIPIQAGRGCPHDCEFCLVSKIYGKKYRMKRIDQIKLEINEIKKYFPHRLIMFADDNLFINRKFSKELLHEIKECNIRWVAQSDISIGDDDELLELIYQSGGLFLLVGFESINPDNLRNLNKSSWKYKQLFNYKKNIDNIQKHGIIVFGSFIFGLDNDDDSVFKGVVDFMHGNFLTGQLTIATPLPGTDLLGRLKNENRLLVKEPFWDKCTFFDVLYQPKKMTVDELENGFIWAYQQLFNEDSFKKRADYLKDIYKGIDKQS